MYKKVFVEGYGDHKEIIVPDECPICGTAHDPCPISAHARKDENKVITYFTYTFQCTKCRRFFHIDNYSDGASGSNRIIPIVAKSDLPPEITDIYPKFAEIYYQALQAQAENLNHIAGMGFRKSVEYLVKFYLIGKHPELENQILSESLAASIKRIEFPNIQILAKACAWLGNDYVHLVIKHPEYDIEAMKMFIKALAATIQTEIFTNAAISLIGDHPKK